MTSSPYRPPHRLGGLLAAAAVLLAVACGGGPSAATTPTTIEREVFIATYVDLRTAAVRMPEAALPDGQRAEILQAHGVTEEDLLEFASARGADVAYMRAVWDEVERRLDVLRVTEQDPEDPRPPADTARRGGSPAPGAP